jgi:PBSX family phage terminase large subunit
MIYRSFSKRQLLAMTWWNRPKLESFDAIICDGAVRSGKTVCMVVGFFLWSMARFDGKVFALCGKTIASLRRNVVIHLQQWLGGVLDVTEHRSDNRLEVRSPDGRRNTYYLFGGQDEGSYMLIQGITLAGALLDEAVLMPRSFVEQTCARCSEEGAKLWFNCNPSTPEHWFYREWLQKCREKNALHLHFTMADNPALPPEVKARYERMYTGHFYRRYVLGQWCGTEGLVYDFAPKIHVTRQLPQAGRYYISVDYGTQNPFSAGLWCVAEGKAVRIREYYYNGRETGKMRTDQEYYEALEELAGDLPVEQVVIDPSAASFIALVRKAGRFRVRRANNEVLPGIQLVAQLLRSGCLLIGAGCKAAIREFSLYSWQSAGAQDQPVKENDHAMDDIRYFCMSILRRNR